MHPPELRERDWLEHNTRLLEEGKQNAADLVWFHENRQLSQQKLKLGDVDGATPIEIKRIKLEKDALVALREFGWQLCDTVELVFMFCATALPHRFLEHLTKSRFEKRNTHSLVRHAPTTTVAKQSHK